MRMYYLFLFTIMSVKETEEGEIEKERVRHRGILSIKKSNPLMESV